MRARLTARNVRIGRDSEVALARSEILWDGNRKYAVSLRRLGLAIGQSLTRSPLRLILWLLSHLCGSVSRWFWCPGACPCASLRPPRWTNQGMPPRPSHRECFVFFCVDHAAARCPPPCWGRDIPRCRPQCAWLPRPPWSFPAGFRGDHASGVGGAQGWRRPGRRQPHHGGCSPGRAGQQ